MVFSDFMGLSQPHREKININTVQVKNAEVKSSLVFPQVTRLIETELSVSNS